MMTRTILALSLAFTGFIRPTSFGQTPFVGAPLPPWAVGTLEIHQISTGRGNAALLIFPDGTSLTGERRIVPVMPFFRSESLGLPQPARQLVPTGAVLVHTFATLSRHSCPGVARRRTSRTKFSLRSVPG